MKKIAISLLIIAGTTSLFAQSVDPCAQTTQLTGGTALSMSGNQGMGNLSGTDYHYEMWVDEGHTSGVKMTWYGANQGGGAAYKAEWTSPDDYLARIGYYWGGNNGPAYSTLKNVYVDFNYTRSGYNTAGNYSYIGIYGWARNSSASNSNEQLIEYYVVDDWFSNQYYNENTVVGTETIFAGKTGGVTYSAAITVDGATYDIYKVARTGPSIAGTTTFTQIFSVRRNMRKCGTISVTEHFKKWEEISGLKFNNMYELKFLTEAGGGTGWLDLSYLKLSQEENQRGSNTSPSSSSNSTGGGTTPSSSSSTGGGTTTPSSSSSTGGGTTTSSSSSSAPVQATTCKTPLVTYPTNTVPSDPYTACFKYTNNKCYVCKVENEQGNNTCKSSWVWNGSEIESNLTSGYWYYEVTCPATSSSSAQSSSSSSSSSALQGNSSSSSNVFGVSSSSEAELSNIDEEDDNSGDINPITVLNTIPSAKYKVSSLGNGSLLIESNANIAIYLYNAKGKVAQKIQAPTGSSIVKLSVQAGLYVVKNAKTKQTQVLVVK